MNLRHEPSYLPPFAIPMAPRRPDYAVKKAGRDGARNVSLAKKSYGTVLKPFHQTHLGRLPPEIREKVFIELLATPPPYAGHDFTTDSSDSKLSVKKPEKFVHITASWYQVTRTCRQIYLEAHPLFFASKAYYLASAEELKFFFKAWYPELPILQAWCPQRPFHHEIITRLCLKDLVETMDLYSKERLDEIFSDPTSAPARLWSRRNLEGKKWKYIGADVYFPLRYLRNLQTLGLCFLVGEEVEHIDFLYGLTGLKRGLVEFPDAHHWTIRQQDAEDVWNIQYAGFFNADRGLNKDGEKFPLGVWKDQRDIADIDSRAPGLQEGDERYVEVQLSHPAKKTLARPQLFGYGSAINWDLAASDQNDVEQQIPLEAHPQIPQDLTEGIEATAVATLAETSEEEMDTALPQPKSNQNDQSSVLELQRSTSPDLQLDANTDHGEDHAATNPEGEDVSSTQPEGLSNLQAEDHPLSSSLVSVTNNTSAVIEKDRELLLEIDEEDNQAQTSTNSKNPAPEKVNLQKDDEFYGDSVTEENQVQNTIKEKKKGRTRRTKIKQALSQNKQPLLEISVTRNPYTEEEMESFEQLAISGKQEPTKKGFHQSEKPVKTQQQTSKNPREASQTKAPEEARPSPASPNQPVLPSKSVQIGGAFLLFLLLGILSLRLPTERLSTERQERKGS